MANKVNSIEDLEQLKAAAAAQGMQVPNYQDWSNVMQQLEEAGVKSTGSYEGDKAKLQEVEKTINDFINEVKTQEVANQKTKETEMVKDTSQTDKEQTIKATVANGTSSMILADYMKYYHLLS